MNFSDIIKKSVLEGFGYNDMSTSRMIVALAIAFLGAMYIHAVYKVVTKNAFYSKNFGVSMAVISVITAGLILAMQSSLVISLGMVGALSIVRFRTAIKDPMDLLFLFWSISVGIICGAGLYELGILMSIVATIGIMLFDMFPMKKDRYLLVLNATNPTVENDITAVLKDNVAYFNIKSKTVTRDGLDMVVEIKTKNDTGQMVEALFKLENVTNVSVVMNGTNR